MNEVETFYGMIESTADALRVFELCRQGRLGRVRRRLHERERKFIRSGSVFVFDEQESGIKRWTDGRVWSPSRILGNFLVYRELERRAISHDDPGPPRQLRPLEPLPSPTIANLFDEVALGRQTTTAWLTQPVIGGDSPQSTNSSTVNRSPQNSCIDPNKVIDMNAFARPRAASLSEGCAPTASFIGPNSSRLLNSKKLQSSSAVQSGQSKYVFRPNGFIKKTISARVDGRIQHLVCYFSEEDFLTSHMPLPLGIAPPIKPYAMMMEELRKTLIPADLVLAQTFRKQPAAEPGFPVFPERTSKRRNSISNSPSVIANPILSTRTANQQIVNIYPRMYENGGDNGNFGRLPGGGSGLTMTDPVTLLLSETSQFIDNYEDFLRKTGPEETVAESHSTFISSGIGVSDLLAFNVPDAPRIVNHHPISTTRATFMNVDNNPLIIGSNDPVLPVIDRSESIEKL